MAQATRLALGEKGPEVRSVQERLTALGYDPGLVDGVFGRVTEEAVKRFQPE